MSIMEKLEGREDMKKIKWNLYAQAAIAAPQPA